MPCQGVSQKGFSAGEGYRPEQLCGTPINALKDCVNAVKRCNFVHVPWARKPLDVMPRQALLSARPFIGGVYIVNAAGSTVPRAEAATSVGTSDVYAFDSHLHRSTHSIRQECTSNCLLCARMSVWLCVAVCMPDTSPWRRRVHVDTTTALLQLQLTRRHATVPVRRRRRASRRL